MPKPILLHYYVTDICNAKCEFCDIWKNKDAHFAELSDVKRNLSDARKLGVRFVDFTGGEPTLNRHLPQFLEEAKRLGFITSVTTNTLLFSRKVAELAGKIDLLHFSLDGDSAEMHDKIRGVTSFDSTINAITLALSYGLIPDLLFTYTDENIDSFMGAYAIARAHKLMIILDPLFTLSATEDLAPESHTKALKYAKLPGVYLNKAHHLLRKNGGNSLEKPICKAVDSTFVVLPTNQLALPCYHHKESQISLDIGLLNVIQSNEYREHQKNQGRRPYCNGCHINCYMDPSYTQHFDRYAFLSMAAKARYSMQKYLIDRRKVPPIPF